MLSIKNMDDGGERHLPSPNRILFLLNIESFRTTIKKISKEFLGPFIKS